MEKITRSQEQRMIAGVLGGIAQAYNWNICILRFLFVLVSICSAAFPGILVYLILWMILPEHITPNSENTPR